MEQHSDMHLVRQAHTEAIDAMRLFSRVQHVLLNLIPAHFNGLAYSLEAFLIPHKNNLGWIEVVLADPYKPDARIKLRLERSARHKNRFPNLSISFGRWDENVEREAPVAIQASVEDWRGVLGPGSSKAWLHRSHGKESTDTLHVYVPKWVQTGETYKINAHTLPAASSPLYDELQRAYVAATNDKPSIDRVIWAPKNDVCQIPGIRELVQTLIPHPARVPLPVGVRSTSS